MMTLMMVITCNWLALYWWCHILCQLAYLPMCPNKYGHMYVHCNLHCVVVDVVHILYVFKCVCACACVVHIHIYVHVDVRM